MPFIYVVGKCNNENNLKVRKEPKNIYENRKISRKLNFQQCNFNTLKVLLNLSLQQT